MPSSFFKRIIAIAEKNKWAFYTLLLAVCFITRLPTLFNDFYDVDELSAIVQVREWLAGYIPGIDFTESKKPLYHLIFKFSYYLSPHNGWVIVHIITILIIFLTAVSIYHIGRVVHGKKAGMLAAILYGALISSFNRHFMATNGEIIYNLPVTAGALFFILTLSSDNIKSRITNIVLCAACVLAATQIKFHGLILAIFIVFVLFVYLPYYHKKLKKILPFYLVIFLLAAAAIIAGYFAGNSSILSIANEIKSKLLYATASRSTNPLFFAGMFIYRQGMLSLWHMIVWIPAFFYIYRFSRDRFVAKSRNESVAAVFFIITYLLIFAGGARLYYHYFMGAYPALCICAAPVILSSGSRFIVWLRGKLTVMILVPCAFFFAWNMKDIYIKHFAPELFYNESAPMFWFRAVIVSSANDYLLPNNSYRAAVDYIKKNSSPNDTVFVWGDGPNINYFADRKLAIKHVWIKGAAISIHQNYENNNIAAAENAERSLIETIEKKKAELIIDTSPKGMQSGVTRLGNYALFPYSIPPFMRKYIESNFNLETKIDGYSIYRRKKK